MKAPIRLISITHGADYELDLTSFEEAEPQFAYVDDVGSDVRVLSGLMETGRITIENQPDYLWLTGPRDCVVLRASRDCRDGDEALLRSLGIGEFCLEIYHLRPDGKPNLLRQDEFCFK